MRYDLLMDLVWSYNTTLYSYLIEGLVEDAFDCDEVFVLLGMSAEMNQVMLSGKTCANCLLPSSVADTEISRPAVAVEFDWTTMNNGWRKEKKNDKQ